MKLLSFVANLLKRQHKLSNPSRVRAHFNCLSGNVAWKNTNTVTNSGQGFFFFFFLVVSTVCAHLIGTVRSSWQSHSVETANQNKQQHILLLSVTLTVQLCQAGEPDNTTLLQVKWSHLTAYRKLFSTLSSITRQQSGWTLLKNELTGFFFFFANLAADDKNVSKGAGMKP